MADFSDIERILRESNPVPRVEDLPVNYDALMVRIMERARPRSHVLAGFRQKIAASVTIAALTTTGLIAGISQLAPSLPVLEFASVASPTASTTPANEATAFLGTGAKTSQKVVAGPELATSPSSALVYEETAPPNPLATTRRIARAFGIDGAVVTGSRRGTWVVRNTTLTLTASLRGTGELDWNVSDTHPCFSVSCRMVLLGGQFTKIHDLQVLANAKSILSNVKSIVPLSSLHQTSSANYNTTISGSRYDIAEHITYDPYENIINAQGVVTTLSVLGDYPILSPSAGISELHSHDLGSFDVNLSSPSKDTQVVNVDRISYRPATLLSGRRVLLPYYEYFVKGHLIGSVASVVPTYLRG